MNLRVSLLALLIALPAAAETPRAFNLYLATGSNPSNVHGHSNFKTITFERTFAAPRIIERWSHLHGLEAGAALSYHDIRQPRSWFGHTYGDPDDSVRGESLLLFLRKEWRSSGELRPFLDLGTGPMWANRRVPAATSRFNFNSQLGLGATLFAGSRWPVLAGYRFQHISNGGATGRNPGLDVHSFFIGATIRKWR